MELAKLENSCIVFLRSWIHGTKVVKLFVDNKSAIALMKNPVFHGRSKHIDTKFHFIRECVEEGPIEVDFTCTEE